MKNQAVANRLYEIADFLEMQDVEYKPRAYRKAARNIETLSEPIEEVYDRGELQDIDGVGESIAEKVADYLETGSMDYYQDLKEDLPVDIEALTSVEGLGPKSVKKLYQALEIGDLEDLERAAEEGRIAQVEGFGEKSQQNILDHIEQAKLHEERDLLGRAFPRARRIEDQFSESENFDRVDIVGSFRRRRPTVGDIDVLATAPDAEAAMAEFCEDDDVNEVLARGPTKSSVIVEGGLQVDLRIVDEKEYGAAKVYFTGSADHNIELRDRAIDRDWKLNEYGLFDLSERSSAEQSEADASDDVSDVEDGGQRAGERLAGETEEGVYDTLDLEFIPPELRENTGEVDAAAEGNLPNLVETDDIRGDLQMHTPVSDGDDDVDALAAKAEEKGHDYILITDHGPALRVTGAVDVESLQEQREKVDQANEEYDVTVMQGVEANVTEDGMDVSADTCADLDLVVAAIHDDIENPTERFCAVMDDYPVDILAHPMNRKLTEREPLDLDLEEIVRTAIDNAVALEINAQPERLDLDWSSVKEYRGDVKFVVSTDAHARDELDYQHLGVAQARRGWCEPDDVLNTRPLDEVLDYFGKSL